MFVLILLQIACLHSSPHDWTQPYYDLEGTSFSQYVSGPQSNSSLIENILSTSFGTSTPNAVYTVNDYCVIVYGSKSSYPTGSLVSVINLSNFKEIYTNPANVDSYFTLRPPMEGSKDVVVCGVNTVAPHSVFCFRDGDTLSWRVLFPQAGSTPTALFVSPTTLLVTNDNSGTQNATYLAINIDNGSILWNSTSFLSTVTTRSLYSGYNLITVDSENNRSFKMSHINSQLGLTAFSVDFITGTSSPIWSYNAAPYTGDKVERVAYGGDIVVWGVFSGSGTNAIYANNATTGEPLWNLTLTNSTLLDGIAFSHKHSLLAITHTNIMVPFFLVSYYYVGGAIPELLWVTDRCPYMETTNPIIDANGVVYVCTCNSVIGMDRQKNIIYSRKDTCTSQPILVPDGSLLYWNTNKNVIRSGMFLAPPSPSTSTSASSTTGGNKPSKDIVHEWWFWAAVGGGGAAIIVATIVITVVIKKRKSTYERII